MDKFGIITSVLSIGRYLKIFLLSLFVIGLASSFLMVILSWNALFLDGQLLISPDLTAEGIIFWAFFSVLAALSITLFFFKSDGMKSAGIFEGGSTAFGAFLGMFTSACAICQPLLLTVLGIPASFAFLPLKGAEFRILSILLIAGSAYLLIESIQRGNLCEPNLKQRVKSAMK